MTGEPIIRVRGLTRRFRRLTAVDGLDLEIRRGEVFALLGPNGAGKTTTVRLLAALLRPSDGGGTVLGLPLTGTAEQQRRIRAQVGLLTERPALYERLSVWNNLRFYARLYGVQDVNGQIERYLRMLSLWERRRDLAGQLSKGMRQKVAVARALLHEPALLFLDEPTSGLDPAAAKALRAFLEEVRDQGRTIVLTSHNLDEVARLADRVAVIRQRVLATGTPTALSRGLFGARTCVQLAGPAAPWVERAAAHPAVRSVDAQKNRLWLEVADPEADNPSVVRALVEAGASVRYVTDASRDLVDAYLELLRRDEGAS